MIFGSSVDSKLSREKIISKMFTEISNFTGKIFDIVVVFHLFL